jgi:hypothetical protein
VVVQRVTGSGGTESDWQWWYRELLAVVVQRVTGSGSTESYWQWWYLLNNFDIMSGVITSKSEQIMFLWFGLRILKILKAFWQDGFLY